MMEQPSLTFFGTMLKLYFDFLHCINISFPLLFIRMESFFCPCRDHKIHMHSITSVYLDPYIPLFVSTEQYLKKGACVLVLKAMCSSPKSHVF